MIIRKVLYFFILFFCTLTIHAQTRCGHVEYMEFLYKNDPTLKHQHDILNKAISARLLKNKISKTAQTSAAELNYKIPVVVHVIHNVSSGEITADNISDAQIFSQIDILNKDYQRTNIDTSDTYAPFKILAADTKISFCLASIDPDGNPTNGIVRVYDQKSNFSIDEEVRLKGISYWPADSYLNIWVCDVTAPILGYAQFPNNTSLPGLSDNMGSVETDGVVIDYRYFGDINTDLPYHMGRTATHEVGHWLGLIHLWGDTYCGDDYINDTPTQDDANVGPGCNTEYSSCDGPTIVDMSQNYMDYSEDACMNLFTNDQKDRMRAVMQVSPKRASLLNSIGCCPYEDRKAIPYGIDFEDDSYLTEGWKIINYDESSVYSKKWEKYTIALTDAGTSSIRIENDSVYTSSQSTYYDIIESPYIDLNHAQMFLDFKLAYANGTFNLDTDSLEIQFSEGCSGNWVSYKTLYGNDLVTTERRTDDFIPLDSEWERVSIDLVHLSGKRWVKFRIAVYSKGINTLYLDDIKFYKEADEFVIYTFPMPVDEELSLEVVYEGYKDVTIQAFDMFGKKVLSLEENDTPSFIKIVDVSNWEPGLYIIKVNTDKDYMPRRIQVY